MKMWWERKGKTRQGKGRERKTRDGKGNEGKMLWFGWKLPEECSADYTDPVTR